MILDRVATLYRMKADPSDADRELYQLEKQGFQINVQPESEEYQALTGSTFGRTYRAFTTQSGIHIRDRIVLSGTTTYSGTEYIVEGIADWNMPPLPHFELRLSEAGI